MATVFEEIRQEYSVANPRVVSLIADEAMNNSMGASGQLVQSRLEFVRLKEFQILNGKLPSQKRGVNS